MALENAEIENILAPFRENVKIQVSASIETRSFHIPILTRSTL